MSNHENDRLRETRLEYFEELGITISDLSDLDIQLLAEFDELGYEMDKENTVSFVSRQGIVERTRGAGR